MLLMAVFCGCLATVFLINPLQRFMIYLPLPAAAAAAAAADAEPPELAADAAAAAAADPGPAQQSCHVLQA